jgi:osmotically-inducible protein OsmY
VTTSKEFGNHGRQINKMCTVGVILSSIAICTVAVVSGCRSARIPEKAIDDAAITKRVKARLAMDFGPIEDRQVRQLDRGGDQQTVSYISVSSVNGVVTLNGEVRGKRAKAKAGEIARSVEQVVSVNNNLSLAPGYSDDAVDDRP